jgi:hypothetical protein
MLAFDAFDEAAALKLSTEKLQVAVVSRFPNAGRRKESKEVLMGLLKTHWQNPVDIEKLTKFGVEVEFLLLGKEVPVGTASELRNRLREAAAQPKQIEPEAPKDVDMSMETVPQQETEAPKETRQANEEPALLRELAELREMKAAQERKKAEKEARKKAEEDARKKAEEDAAAAAAAAEAASAEEAAAEDAADEAYQLVFEEQLQKSREKKAPERKRETKFSSPRGRVTEKQKEAHKNMRCTLVAARLVTPITKKGFAKTYKPVGKPWKPDAGTNALALPRPGGHLKLQLGFVVHGQKTTFYVPIDHVAKESYAMHPGLRDAAQCAGSLSRPLSVLREEEAQYEARVMTDWLLQQQLQPVDP